MKKKVLKISLLSVFIVILTILGIFNLLNNVSNAKEETSNNGYEVTKPSIIIGQNPNTYVYDIIENDWETKYIIAEDRIPVYGSYEIYCTQADADFKIKNRTGSLWEIQWDEELAKLKELAEEKFEVDCKMGPRNHKYEGMLSPIIYKYQGTTDLTAAEAYVVSSAPKGHYSTIKQWGIWTLLQQSTAKSNTPAAIAGQKLAAEAQQYAIYDQEIKASNNGLDPKNLTDITSITTKVDISKGQYTIGKFSISYINGIYDNVTFGGISEMTVVGYNKDKQQVKDNIKIQKIILSETGETLVPRYFTPIYENEEYVDRSEQKYPKSGEAFEIVINNPNAGVEVNDPNRIAYVSLKVKFKYMMAYGKKAEFIGTQYDIKYKDYPDETLNPHEHTMCTSDCIHRPAVYIPALGRWVDTSTHHRKTIKCCGVISEGFLAENHQQNTISVGALRVIFEQELIITPDEKNLTIDLEGKVWEDMKDGKENLVDGEYGEKDVLVNGVDVVLYDDKDNEIAKTQTDYNGKYEFRDLDPMRKYYVEFKYNGQQYQNTIYTDKLDGKHSVATDDNRDEFNKKFEELDGSMNNVYEIRELTYQDNQRNGYYNSPKEFAISAYTGSNGKSGLVKYPKQTRYVIGDTNTTVAGTSYSAVYAEKNSIKNVDFGITQRIEFDMAVKKDLYVATVKINGKTEVYGYDKRNIGNNDGSSGDTWTIEVVGGYDRSLDKADWSFTGQNGNTNALLEVYATYKVAVRNQSMSMLGYVTKLYDYYDDSFQYMKNLSWQSSKNLRTTENQLKNIQVCMEAGNAKGLGSEVKATDSNGTLTIDVNKKQKTGETQYIYLTFKIKNDNGKVKLGTMKNKVEIGAFKTYYSSGTTLPHYETQNNYVCPDDNMIAGRVDKDSKPSTMGKGGSPKEDDEDEAPSLNVKLTGNTRKLTGIAWEDNRTQSVGNAVIGNGILDSGEKGIAGIEVQLIEKTVWTPSNQNAEYVWQTVTTGANGAYTFDGYIPGDYIIRFKYGEGLSSAAKNDGKSYNGQDYKTTTYQVGIDQSGKTDLDGKYDGYTNVETQNESGKYGFNIATMKNNVSSAKDIWADREKVNNYSKTNVTNFKAEVLASPYRDNTSDTYKQELIKNTTMTAESGVVVIEVECNKQSQLENGNPSYSIDGLNIGLVERPKAQLEIDKSITNIKVTSASGAVLFDVNKKGDNVVWKDHSEYNLASKKKNNIYTYSYRDVSTIKNSIVDKADKGLVQISMDEELMHGSTIEITYAIKITNAGEVDYDGKAFYYKGEQTGSIVTTTANQIIDYVSNNLKFDKSKNDGWSIIRNIDAGQSGVDEIYDTAHPNEFDGRLVKTELAESWSKFNNIITTKFNDALQPGGTCEKTLVLSQVITTENKSDDLTYRNIVEIVKTSNTVGRRMAYSIVGNQDPTQDAQEVDTSVAEKVIILPPFGDTHIYYILGFTIGIILIGGITLILRKVLKK